MKYIALCHTCKHQHKIEFDPRVGAGNAFSDWYTKHGIGHKTEFRYPRRRQRDGKHTPDQNWGSYLHNADIKVAYASSVQPTFSLNSLAASSTLLAGRSSDVVVNTSNKYLDYLTAGNYRSAASNNQAGTIYTCVVAAYNDTPTYHDVFNGSDANKTVSKSGVFNAICKILSAISADNTATQDWPFGPCSVAQLYSGWVPTHFQYFVTHNIQTSTNTWNSATNFLYYTPVYATST